MQSTVMDEVGAISQALANKIGTQKYGIWFGHSTKFALADGYLKITVPNLFIAGWIENHFLSEINNAVESAVITSAIMGSSTVKVAPLPN